MTKAQSVTNNQLIPCVVVRGKFHASKDVVKGIGETVELTENQVLKFRDQITPKAEVDKVNAVAREAESALTEAKKELEQTRKETAELVAKAEVAKAELAKAEADKAKADTGAKK